MAAFMGMAGSDRQYRPVRGPLIALRDIKVPEDDPETLWSSALVRLRRAMYDPASLLPPAAKAPLGLESFLGGPVSLRSFDLQKHHLLNVSFATPTTRTAVRRLADYLQEGRHNNTELLVMEGFHDFTIRGTPYRVDVVGVWKDGVVEEAPDLASFVVSLQRRPEVEGEGMSLTQAQVIDVINKGLDEGEKGFAYARAKFRFPDSYEAPLVAAHHSEGEIDVESSGPLMLSGVRYSTSEGFGDVLIDGTFGGVTVDLNLMWTPVTSLADVRLEVQRLVDFSALLVREVEETVE